MSKPVIMVYNTSKNRWEELYSSEQISNKTIHSIVENSQDGLGTITSLDSLNDNVKMIIPSSDDSDKIDLSNDNLIGGFIRLSDLCVSCENVINKIDYTNSDNPYTAADTSATYYIPTVDALSSFANIDGNKISIGGKTLTPLAELPNGSSGQVLTLSDDAETLKWTTISDDNTTVVPTATFYSPAGAKVLAQYGYLYKNSDAALPDTSSLSNVSAETPTYCYGHPGSDYKYWFKGKTSNNKTTWNYDDDLSASRILPGRICYLDYSNNKHVVSNLGSKLSKYFDVTNNGYIICKKTGYISLSASSDIYFLMNDYRISTSKTSATANNVATYDYKGKSWDNAMTQWDTVFWRFQYSDDNGKTWNNMSQIHTIQAYEPFSHTATIAPKVFYVKTGRYIRLALKLRNTGYNRKNNPSKAALDCDHYAIIQNNHAENYITISYLSES